MFHPLPFQGTKRRPVRRGLRFIVLTACVAAATSMALSARSQTTPANPMTGARLVAADSRLLNDVAEGNRAEIQAGRLALEKSQNAEVRKFAQNMVDDHGKALAETQGLAQQKGVELSQGIGVGHRTKELALKALPGGLFDSQYVKRAGVGDHEDTVKLLTRIQAEAQDPELKALASKMLPTVQHHLEMAKQLAATIQ